MYWMVICEGGKEWNKKLFILRASNHQYSILVEICFVYMIQGWVLGCCGIKIKIFINFNSEFDFKKLKNLLA